MGLIKMTIILHTFSDGLLAWKFAHLDSNFTQVRLQGPNDKLHPYMGTKYRKVSNIRRTKYQNLNVSRLIL